VSVIILIIAKFNKPALALTQIRFDPAPSSINFDS